MLSPDPPDALARGTAAPVAIAVVSWNTRDLLRACLASLAGDVAAGRAEVWVVDNGSSDGSLDMARSEFGWAHLVEADENLGFGVAVNLVAERTTTDWIAPANADVALEPGALGALLAAGDRHPEAAVVAPRLLRPDGRVESSVFPFPSVGVNLLASLGLDRGSDPDEPREVDWAVGAFLLVRRAAFDEVGGFDPRQWMYAEDLDLGWRLSRAGWRAWYEPSAAVTHIGSAATGMAFGDAGARRERWMEATYDWMVRRRGRTRTAAIAAVSTGATAARALRGDPELRAWARLHARGVARAFSRGDPSRK